MPGEGGTKENEPHSHETATAVVAIVAVALGLAVTSTVATPPSRDASGSVASQLRSARRHHAWNATAVPAAASSALTERTVRISPRYRLFASGCAGQTSATATDGSGNALSCAADEPALLPWPPAGPRWAVALLLRVLVFYPVPVLPGFVEMACCDG